MTETVYLFLGILLILGIFLDILFTTYSMEGGGKMTDVVLSNVWKLILWIARYQGTKKMLNHAGMFMMFGLILLWGLGLWVGFFLILASDPNSILSSGTGTAASLGEKFYFSGYILSTMGLGDYEPNNAVWGTVSSLFSFLGIVFITLIVSYVLPVLSKIVEKKQFSLYINHMGSTPQDLLLYFWNGKDFSEISQFGDQLRQQVLLISQSHKAYPVLHYFHTSRQNESLTISLCLIDEALDILINRVARDQWEDKEIRPLRLAFDVYLNTMRDTYRYKKRMFKPMERDISKLTAANVRLSKGKEQDAERKALWKEVLRSKGWSWDDVYTAR